jgi:hypothetical protein
LLDDPARVHDCDPVRYLALLDEYQQRFLARVAPDVAEVVRLALAGRVDGQPRRLLARQIVLLALRLVLVPPDPVRPASAGAGRW